MPADGLGPGVEAGCSESVSLIHDGLYDLLGQGCGAAVWAAGGRLERLLALGAVAGHDLRHPALADPELAGGLALGEALNGDGGDDRFTVRHPQIPLRWGFRCLGTGVSYVLESDTTPSANVLSRDVGDKVRLDIRVRDEQGRPVQGTFSLAVADEKLLTYADDKQNPWFRGFLLFGVGIGGWCRG